MNKVRRGMESKKRIGIDLGGTSIRVGLVQNGKILKLDSHKYNAQGTEEEVLQTLFSRIDALQIGTCASIGVGVPTLVDVEKGIVYDTLNIPSWKEVPLKDLLQQRYHLPVFINNDANCFTLGEQLYGKARHYQNVVGMVLGTGVGAGIIIGGQLYSGRHCGAGEFGCIPFLDRTLEDYCSGSYFKTFHGISGEEMSILAGKGDSTALQAFAAYGRYLGTAIIIVLYAVDPDCVILGGSASHSYNYFRDTLWQTLQKFAYQRTVRDLKIEISESDEISVLGAAALCTADQKG